jgi:hypothetical protein
MNKHLSVEQLLAAREMTPSPELEHLHSCETCQAAFRALGAVTSALRSLPLVQPPPTLWGALAAKERSLKRRRRTRLVSIGAALALVLGTFFGVWLSKSAVVSSPAKSGSDERLSQRLRLLEQRVSELENDLADIGDPTVIDEAKAIGWLELQEQLQMIDFQIESSEKPDPRFQEILLRAKIETLRSLVDLRLADRGLVSL